MTDYTDWINWGLEFNCICIVDVSGSMAQFIGPLMQKLKSLQTLIWANGGNIIFITFDNKAYCARDLNDLKFTEGTTNILAALIR
jgi:hypothetical protein